MPSIHVLSDMLVKKIAAGEMIERPASVVKELMENSVDSGATHVRVTTEEGGRALIRVSDDGCGMSPEELPLAVTPHATSKIVDEDDLYRINSMGFRGEALASIGAVSRMRMVSRLHEETEGGEIIVEAERVVTDRAAGCPAGTSIEVRDLFFNVPARRKFLRQSSTESGHITTQFSRLALAYPNVGFDLTSGKRSVHQLAAGRSRRERIGQLFSPELSDSLIEIRRDEMPLAIEGYAARPADSRSNTNWQFTFVNGRFIRDKFVQHAIREAYRGLIDPHRAAVVFLFLTVDPAEVDVNVHPTKIEVRWQDSGMVHSQVLSALREALNASDLTPAFDVGRTSGGRSAVAPDPEVQDRVRREFVEAMRQATPTQGGLQFEPFGASNRTERPGREKESGVSGGLRSAPPGEARSPSPVVRGGPDDWRALYGSPDQTSVSMNAESVPVIEPGQLPGAIRGAIQLHNTYLVCETDDGMVIIDQHALHERIIYDQLKNRLTDGRLDSQRLLLPETVTVTPAEAALLETHADLLERLGLEVTPFGSDSVAVHSFPVLLKDVAAGGFVRDLIDTLSQQGNQPESENIIHEVLDMMACKAAVKAGDPLTAEEIDALIVQKELVEKSSNCPHGRPTTLRLTVKELERQFKRT